MKITDFWFTCIGHYLAFSRGILFVGAKLFGVFFLKIMIFTCLFVWFYLSSLFRNGN